MSVPKIEDLRFASSCVDDFPNPRPRKIVASAGRVRVADVHQLAGFQFIAEDQLVHVSQQDFWQLGKDGEGFYIERLVDDDQGPIAEGK